MKSIFSVLFATAILLTATIATSEIQYAEALKGQGVGTSKYGSSTGICGLQLCSEIPGGKAAYEQQQGKPTVIIPKYGMEQKGLPLSSETVHEKRAYGEICQCTGDCNCSVDGTCNCSGEEGLCMCGPNCTCGAGMHETSGCNCSEDGTCSCGEGCACGTEGCNCSADGTCTCGEGCNCGTMHGMTGYKKSGHVMKEVSGTMQSATDPGKGHEQHQLAVLLPPSDKMYKGILSYSASENVQLVALHGPLDEGQDMGQTIWTPDGDTKFALTLVNPEDKMGTWMFTGNALAVHTFSEDPFAITYSIATMSSVAEEYKMMHGTGGCNCSADGTCSCGEGCACGTEGCNCSADGTCTCGTGCACGQ